MSTKLRKERKAAGIKFVKAAKVPTPLTERLSFAGLVFDPIKNVMRPRSMKKTNRILRDHGLPEVEAGA